MKASRVLVKEQLVEAALHQGLLPGVIQQRSGMQQSRLANVDSRCDVFASSSVRSMRCIRSMRTCSSRGEVLERGGVVEVDVLHWTTQHRSNFCSDLKNGRT